MQHTPSPGLVPASLCVVVPAHNEAACLADTLACISSAVRAVGWQDRHELVVVDDSSTDCTAEVARQAGARVVQVQHRQIASTRNAGAAASSAPWLLFVDADTHLNPEVLQAALTALENGAVGGGAGVEFDEPVPRWVRAVMPLSLWFARCVGLAAGCFFYARRVDFEAVGGFDPGIYAGEELHLSRLLKRRGRFVVLRQKVLSSGRKLRTFGPGELLAALWRIVLAGRRGLRSREGLDLWYAPRRRDPNTADSQAGQTGRAAPAPADRAGTRPPG